MSNAKKVLMVNTKPHSNLFYIASSAQRRHFWKLAVLDAQKDSKVQIKSIPMKLIPLLDAALAVLLGDLLNGNREDIVRIV